MNIIEENNISVKIEDIPLYAVTYMAYGDEDSITPEEKKEIDKFMKENNLKQLNECGETKGFCSKPAFGLPCDTVDGTFIKRQNENDNAEKKGLLFDTKNFLIFLSNQESDMFPVFDMLEFAKIATKEQDQKIRSICQGSYFHDTDDLIKLKKIIYTKDFNEHLKEIKKNNITNTPSENNEYPLIYGSQLPDEMQQKLIKDMYEDLINEGYSEELAKEYSEDYPNEKLYTIEEKYGKNFWETEGFKKLVKKEEPSLSEQLDDYIESIQVNGGASNSSIENLLTENKDYTDKKYEIIYFKDGTGYFLEEDGSHEIEFDRKNKLVKTSDKEGWKELKNNYNNIDDFIDDVIEIRDKQSNYTSTFKQYHFPPKEWKYNDITKGLKQEEIEEINKKTSDSWKKEINTEKLIENWKKAENEKYPENRNKKLYEIFCTFECINNHELCSLLLKRDYDKIERVISNNGTKTIEEYLQNMYSKNSQIKTFCDSVNMTDNHNNFVSMEKYLGIMEKTYGIEIYNDKIYKNGKETDFGDTLKVLLSSNLIRSEYPESWDISTNISNDYNFICNLRQKWANTIENPLTKDDLKKLENYSYNIDKIYNKDKAFYDRLDSLSDIWNPNNFHAMDNLIKFAINKNHEEIKTQFFNTQKEYEERKTEIDKLKEQLSVMKKLNNIFEKTVIKFCSENNEHNIEKLLSGRITENQKISILHEVEKLTQKYKQNNSNEINHNKGRK